MPGDEAAGQAEVGVMFRLLLGYRNPRFLRQVLCSLVWRCQGCTAGRPNLPRSMSLLASSTTSPPEAQAPKHCHRWLSW